MSKPNQKQTGLPKEYSPDGRDRSLKRLLEKDTWLTDIERLEYFYLLSPYGYDKYNGTLFSD